MKKDEILEAVVMCHLLGITDKATFYKSICYLDNLQVKWEEIEHYIITPTEHTLKAVSLCKKLMIFTPEKFYTSKKYYSDFDGILWDQLEPFLIYNPKQLTKSNIVNFPKH